MGVSFFSRLTDTVSSHTKGLKTVRKNRMTPADTRAYCSGTCSASCLGYNSPNTRVT